MTKVNNEWVNATWQVQNHEPKIYIIKLQEHIFWLGHTAVLFKMRSSESYAQQVRH